jgi:hypothetical protein
MAPSDQSDQPDALEVSREFRPYGPDREQLDMFGAPPPEEIPDPDPESVRAELLGILAKARAAPQVPWSAKEASYYRTVFPQMANWLPAEEAQQLRLQFAAELARLEAA